MVKKVKAQEWIVRFDGTIEHQEEEFIDLKDEKSAKKEK